MKEPCAFAFMLTAIFQLELRVTRLTGDKMGRNNNNGQVSHKSSLFWGDSGDQRSGFGLFGQADDVVKL